MTVCYSITNHKFHNWDFDLQWTFWRARINVDFHVQREEWPLTKINFNFKSVYLVEITIFPKKTLGMVHFRQRGQQNGSKNAGHKLAIILRYCNDWKMECTWMHYEQQYINSIGGKHGEYIFLRIIFTKKILRVMSQNLLLLYERRCVPTIGTQSHSVISNGKYK